LESNINVVLMGIYNTLILIIVYCIILGIVIFAHKSLHDIFSSSNNSIRKTSYLKHKYFYKTEEVCTISSAVGRCIYVDFDCS